MSTTTVNLDRQGKPRAFDGWRIPAIGDRVRVKAGKAHDEMTADVEGTIKIIDGTALGVLFDGTGKVHKWYVAAELDPEPDGRTLSALFEGKK